MSTIITNSVTLGARAAALTNAGSGFNMSALSPTASDTTITANSNLQSVFINAKQGNGSFSSILAGTSTQLRNIGSGFASADSSGAKSFEHTAT